ncbi:MAG: OmpA family protein [Chlorobi bacterium]|nr:OmpA family protein [Chlorobiota bacterium]
MMLVPSLLVAQDEEDPILFQEATLRTKKEYDAYIVKNAPSENSFVAVGLIAGIYIKQKKWQSAVDIYLKYKPLFPNISDKFDDVISILYAKDEVINIERLPDEINIPGFRTYGPVPSADNKGLYFCSLNRPDGFGYEDIYYSQFANNKWQESKNLGGIINDDGFNYPSGISSDGNTLYMLNSGRNAVLNMETHKQRTVSWSNPNEIKEVYSDYWQCDLIVSSDGKTLFFASDRLGNIGDLHRKDTPYHGHIWGNIDIYVCPKKPDGTWSEPINLGKNINTHFAERSPFLHPDGKTFYFSSDGHAGLGRLDVFKCTRLNDTSWTDWSKPVNLGKEVNTSGDDWGYKISTTGDKAYYARQDPNTKLDEIYSTTLPESAKPKPVAVVHGKVLDEKNIPIYDAPIKWENLSTNKVVGEMRSNPQDGTYFIVLPLGNNYGCFAEKDGYYPVSSNIDLSKTNESKDIEYNFKLLKIIENSPILIKNVFFGYDKYELEPESFPELNRLAEMLKKTDEKIKIQIMGHTDNQGTDNYNFTLSKNRAEAVSNYLINKGCSPIRISAKGYGKSNPISNNETEEGKAQNRRVEFMLVK